MNSKKSSPSLRAKTIDNAGMANGKLQPYRVSTPPSTRAKERSLSYLDKVLLAIVGVIAVVIRYYKLWQPSSVVFDEVHFGGFARKYIIGRFFMDVHPPLAKMMYAVVGYLAGYDGEFEFKEIGLDYIENNVPYVAMRLLPTTLGFFTVLLSYATLKASGCKSYIAFFGSLLVTIDNALITQSRFILLDSPLLFFIAITAYGFKRFENEVPFTKNWYRYMLLTGLGLGATVSSKWVGLFTIAWVGAQTLYQLWWIIGDLRTTPTAFAKHFGARVVLLIGVPLAFYLGMFALHFICVVNDGDGAAFLSPEFQSTLQHSKLNSPVTADVAFGSEITLRHLNTQGGYLHSHEHMYETGSKQQQITLYPHKDENNIWVIENITEPDATDAPVVDFTTSPPVFIEDGTILRLRHKPTDRRLHSHDHRPPISEQDHQNEVSAYGYKDFEGDANDNFRVEIIERKSEPGVARERVRTLQTKFRLIHTITGCALFSHNVKLPKWAYEQQEVTCIKGGTLPNSIWFIEENNHPMLGEDAEKITYRKPGFLEKFVELNKVMWTVNAGLTDSHTWESRPESWPLLKRGINFWVKDHRQVYLVGNAVIWWSVTGVILLYVMFKAVWVLRWQRGYKDFQNDAHYATFDSGFGSYLLGWALHYFPSFLMARQLFLHHYLGSLYFGILALTQAWEFLTSRLIRNKLVSVALSALFFSSAAAFFAWYSPLIYGSPWTQDLCTKSKFLDMDFDCDTFLSSFDEYSNYIPEVSTVEPTEAVDSLTEEVFIDSEGSIVEQEAFQAGEEKEGAKPVEQLFAGETDELDKEKAAGISPGPKSGSSSLELDQLFQTTLLSKEEKVEYRDADGNVLKPEEVERLVAQGLIEIQTLHNTRNVYYDKNGNELQSEDVERWLKEQESN